MKKTRVNTVSIAPGHGQGHLSKTQKTFNSLIKQIERRRAELAAWEAVIPAYQSKYAGEMIPLQEKALDLQVNMVDALDRASQYKGLTRTERRKVSGLIAELAGNVVAARDDERVKAIYNKHSDTDYDAEQAASAAGYKTLLENVTGFDLGEDVEGESIEAMLERARENMARQQEQFEADQRLRDEKFGARKKSAKQLAREARQKADEQKLRQSIREIYRKLASALHPDREPDAVERERKTALMQRANQAYEKNNLLQLLELQLELEHIDQSTMDNIGEERLRDYIKILGEQSIELDMKIQRVADGFGGPLGASPDRKTSPDSAMKNLTAEISATKRAIREIGNDLLATEDLKKLKAWLRTVQLAPADDWDDIPF